MNVLLIKTSEIWGSPHGEEPDVAAGAPGCPLNTSFLWRLSMTSTLEQDPVVD